MTQTAALEASARGGRGKGAARALRRAGRIPAVIYGRGREPEALELDRVALERLLARIRASTTIVDVTVDDRRPVKALIRDLQRDPLRPASILHVDLYEVHADEQITVDVPLQFVGTAEGVRNAGGVFEVLSHRVQVRVLPANIPERIEVDVNHLGLGQSLHVSDLTVPSGEVLTDPRVTVCTVVAPRVEEAPVAPGAEAGAAPEEPAEPELIRKPKAAEEEEEAETEGKD
jgi:large subunit ribosomal protein L25